MSNKGSLKSNPNLVVSEHAEQEVSVSISENGINSIQKEDQIKKKRTGSPMSDSKIMSKFGSQEQAMANNSNSALSQMQKATGSVNSF